MLSMLSGIVTGNVSTHWVRHQWEVVRLHYIQLFYLQCLSSPWVIPVVSPQGVAVYHGAIHHGLNLLLQLQCKCGCGIGGCGCGGYQNHLQCNPCYTLLATSQPAFCNPTPTPPCLPLNSRPMLSPPPSTMSGSSSRATKTSDLVDICYPDPTLSLDLILITEVVANEKNLTKNLGIDELLSACPSSSPPPLPLPFDMASSTSSGTQGSFPSPQNMFSWPLQGETWLAFLMNMMPPSTHMVPCDQLPAITILTDAPLTPALGAQSARNPVTFERIVAYTNVRDVSSGDPVTPLQTVRTERRLRRNGSIM